MPKIRGPRDVQQLGTILTIWAHPDDETFCAGGLLAMAVRSGQTVVCVTATRGEAGSQDPDKWPISDMARVRSDEMKAALDELGIKQHHWLDYQDGHCQSANANKAAEEILELIKKYQPDTILTFGPDGLTGHPDHATVSKWVSLAVAQAQPKPKLYHAVLTLEQYQQYMQSADAKLNLFFNIDQPPLAEASKCDICLTCSDELCNCKHAAFAAMPSQYDKMFALFDQAYLNEAFRVEAFVEAKD